MRISVPILAVFVLSALNQTGAWAQTQDLELTHYMVIQNEGQTVETPQGRTVTVDVTTHGNVVDRRTGTEYSQWCYGENQGAQSGAGVPGAGYCTLVDDDGDVWWVSYVVHGDGRPTTWSVIGGSGKYLDATGGGTHGVVSQRGDGRAWTAQSTGTLTTE